MQRPCAQLGKNASSQPAKAGLSRASSPLLLTGQAGRVDTNPQKNPINEPQQTLASTNQYKSVQVNTTNENIFSHRLSTKAAHWLSRALSRLFRFLPRKAWISRISATLTLVSRTQSNHLVRPNRAKYCQESVFTLRRHATSQIHWGCKP
jgi:hypothetical protein